MKIFLFCLFFGNIHGFRDEFENIFKNSNLKTTNCSSAMPRYVVRQHFGKDENRTKLLFVVSSINYDGAFPIGPLGTKSMEIALDRLFRNSTFLAGFELVLEMIDDECSDDLMINRVIRKMLITDNSVQTLPMVNNIGCATFGQLTVAEALQNHGILTFSKIPLAPQLYYNRRRYRSFFGLGDRADIGHDAFVSFVIHMGWRKVAILGEMLKFYDSMEDIIIPHFEKLNVTILWYGKVSYMSSDSDELEKTFEEMAKRKPRIILLNADSGMNMGCWLHRFGLYGPNYVTVFVSWAGLDPKGSMPEYVAEWCSPEMIAEVLKSTLTFGDDPFIDRFDHKPDSTGLTSSEFLMELKERVPDGDTHFLWPSYTSFGYDQALFTGFFVDKLNQILRNHNKTLGKDPISVELMEEALYSLGMVRGIKAEHHFEASTTVNSKGYQPVVFTQYDVDEQLNVNPRVVAFYKSKEETTGQPFHFYTERLVWKTKDGRPPKDEPVIKLIERLLVPESVTIALYSIGSVNIVLLLATVAISMKNKRAFSRADWILFLGNLLLMGQAFASPWRASKTIHFNCNAVAVLALIGLALLSYGNLLKLRAFGKYSTKFMEQLIFGIWLAINVSFMAALLTTSPISSKKVEISQYEDVEDMNVIISPYFYGCHFELAKSRSSIGFLSALGTIQLSALIQQAALAFAARHSTMESGKSISSIVYCEIITIAATILISLTLDHYVVVIVVQFGCLALAFASNAALLNPGRVESDQQRSHLGSTARKAPNQAHFNTQLQNL